MVGEMIKKARTDKGLTKTELAKIVKVDIGHLSHIEKGERNPSHKVLKAISEALDISYQQIMYGYKYSLKEDKEEYKITDYLSYNKVLLVDNILKFIDCNEESKSANIAVKMYDHSMENKIRKGSPVFIEFNYPLKNGEIGIFQLNGKILIRTFKSENEKIILEPDNKSYENIEIDSLRDKFYIIGRCSL